MILKLNSINICSKPMNDTSEIKSEENFQGYNFLS
jgi:hypothetical protein